MTKQGEGAGSELPLRRPMELEVMQETLMTYRIQVKMQPSPAKISIEYTNREGPRRDLKVYASTSHKEPKEH